MNPDFAVIVLLVLVFAAPAALLLNWITYSVIPFLKKWKAKR